MTSPPLNSISSDISPRKRTTITMPPKAILPTLNSIFAMSSLNVVRFLAFLTGDFLIFFIPHVLSQGAFLPEKDDICHIKGIGE